MRPISVSFQCFGPYMEKQFVDFEALREKGIFLICGETGAGKTTILDAMCYALFGESSGGARGELEAMRCKNAGKDDVTFVEFIFEISGRRYRFYRELRYARKNLNLSCEYGVRQDDVWAPLDANSTKTKMDAWAERLIGLTCAQFRQVIILPQGKFEELLVSDSKAKEAILSTLFHTEQWETLLGKIRDRVNEEKKRLENEKAGMDAQLGGYQCGNPEQLAEMIAAENEAALALRAMEQTALTEKNAAANRYENAKAENVVFAELKDREKKLAELASQAETMKAAGERLALAEAAERIREQHKAFADAKRSLTEATGKHTTAKTAYAAAEVNVKKAEAARKQHEDGRQSYEEAKKNIALMENVRGVYSDIEAKKANAQALYNRYNDAARAAEKAADLYQKADKQWNNADLHRKAAQENAELLHNLYRANIYGILASELEAGKPCPVCGSIHHDAPAAISEGEKVTDRMLDDADAEAQMAAKAESTARGRRADLEKARDEARGKADQARTAFETAAAAYKAAEAQLLPGIADMAALEKKLSALSAKAKLFEEAEKKTADAVKNASGELAAARQALGSAAAVVSQMTDQRIDAEESWLAALASENFADEGAYLAAVMEAGKRNTLVSRIAAYNEACKTARKALAEQQKKTAGLITPDLAALEAEKRDSEAKWTKVREDLVTLQDNIKKMQGMYEKLSSQWTRYQQAKSALDANTAFLLKLDPKSGLSLQRYVLGIMLASITAAANELLKSVHGGRYQLRRSDTSTSGNKSGLELNVFDSSNGECRSVKTLSGGEKFLVSLSLAIGLSTVVQTQSGGTKLEAMFIDEGFGSLDGESINDALDVLNGIRKGHGLVGIISHVDQLADTIPTRIEVKKAKDGNRISTVY